MGFQKVATLLFVVAAISCATGEIYFQKGAPQVKLSNNALLSGSVEYSREGRPFHSFIGVPYGNIPQRFQEAEPVPAWEGVHDATKPGNICTQPFLDPKSGKLSKAGEEDCLNLNVYVPMNNTQRKGGLNVMVWIHGGGFLVGSGYGYGPKFFMDEDVILVTVNYRLGVFGFLSTGDSVVPGNNGLKDQVLSLKWVQDHIKNFGGNPEKVTIYGESAGAASVHYLLLSPTTKGLFKDAISQSGSALASWAYHPDPKPTAVNLATYLKCPTSSEISTAEILACLTELSDEKLNEAQFMFANRWPLIAIPLQFGPVKEAVSTGHKTPFLTESPWSLVLEKSTSHKEIPWMVGTTEDEGSSLYSGYILQDKTVVNELDSDWSKIALRAHELDKFALPAEEDIVSEKIRKFYFGDKPISTETRQSLTNLYSDSFFTYSVRKSAIETALKGKKNPVYLYQYAHVGPASMMNLFGFPVAEEELKQVGHADDVILQFNLENLFPGAVDLVKADSAHEEFSKHFVKAWVSFAIHGKPKYSWGTSTKEWKPISKDELEGKSPLRWYKIHSPNPGYIEEKQKATERVLFWEKLYKDHLLHSLLPSSSKGKKTEL